MKYLLDTCVVSELAKKRPVESVLRWFSTIEEDDLYVSSVTIGEIRKGIERYVKWRTENVKCVPCRMLTWGDVATPAGRARSPSAPQCRAFGFPFSVPCSAAGVRALPRRGQTPTPTPPPRSLRPPREISSHAENAESAEVECSTPSGTDPDAHTASAFSAPSA